MQGNAHHQLPLLPAVGHRNRKRGAQEGERGRILGGGKDLHEGCSGGEGSHTGRITEARETRKAYKKG